MYCISSDRERFTNSNSFRIGDILKVTLCRIAGYNPDDLPEDTRGYGIFAEDGSLMAVFLTKQQAKDKLNEVIIAAISGSGSYYF